MTLDLTHFGKSGPRPPKLSFALFAITITVLILSLIVLLPACDHQTATNPSIPPGTTQKTPDGPAVTPEPPPNQASSTTIPTKSVTCDVIKETLVLRNQTAKLPQAGRFVVESHLATTADTFPNGRLFPEFLTDRSQIHLDRACSLLKSNPLSTPKDPGCKDVFDLSFKKVWTPPESGKAGQGSVGNKKPTALEEMWSGNMNWTSSSKPFPGTKFLASANGRHVVIVMGYETGPHDPKYLGGLQPEPHWYLKTSALNQIRIARLLDQNLPPGPIECK